MMRYLLLFILLLGTRLAWADTLPIQKPAEDAAVFPMYLPVLGQNEKLQLIKGPALVNIFATWCGPCMAEHPQLLALHKQLNIPVYGIALHDNPALLNMHLAKHGNPYNQIFMDDKGASLMQMQMNSVPITLLLDGQQNIRWLLPDPIMPNMLPALMKQIAAEKVESTPPPKMQNLRPIAFVDKSSPAP